MYKNDSIISAGVTWEDAVLVDSAGLDVHTIKMKEDGSFYVSIDDLIQAGGVASYDLIITGKIG